MGAMSIYNLLSLEGTASAARTQTSYITPVLENECDTRHTITVNMVGVLNLRGFVLK